MNAFNAALGFVLVAALAGCSHEAAPDAHADHAETHTDHADHDHATPPAEETGMSNAYVLDHTAETITGESKDLAEYKGRVVMVVNVASKCGFTGQYEPLEKLYSERKGEGFVVLGFPANNFKEQEPGTNEEIAEFCQSTYGVDFPMFAKIDVIGENAHPLYKELASQPAPIGGDPEWNFTKFLVNRKGEVVYRFDTRTSPDDPKVIAAIDELLAQDAG